MINRVAPVNMVFGSTRTMTTKYHVDNLIVLAMLAGFTDRAASSRPEVTNGGSETVIKLGNTSVVISADAHQKSSDDLLELTIEAGKENLRLTESNTIKRLEARQQGKEELFDQILGQLRALT